MSRLSQILKTAVGSTHSGGRSSIDAIRVTGPARERLLNRFGTSQLSAFEDAARAGGLPIETGVATDRGLRLRNEDSALVMIGQRMAVNGLAPAVFAAIADGMGGQEMGDTASAAAIETLAEAAAKNFFLAEEQLMPAMPDADMLEAMLSDAVTQAHQAVVKQASGGGTTLTCLLAWNNMLHVAHVGDSRAYLVKAGSIDTLTTDHRIVRQMQDAGILSADDARYHPQRNVLYRVLGMEEGFTVDVASRPLNAPCRLLLCTDGVWGPLHVNDIYMWVLLGQTPQEITERLVRDAMLRQPNDNATAVLLHIPDRP